MYSHIVSFEETPLLKLDNIGTSSDPNNNRFGPGRRDIYLIHYVVKGKGYFNGAPVHAGQGFLVCPGDSEYYYPDSENPWEFVWITSHDKNMLKLFELYHADETTRVFDYDSVQIVKNLIPNLKKKHNQIFSPSEILEIYLHLLNSHIARPNISNEEYYFKYVENYVSTHIYTPIKIKQLTDVLGISQQYLHQIFVKQVGISPKRYICEVKLSEAKRLLVNTDMPITEIGNSVGYSDVLSFSKFFALQTGTSPKKYRVEHQKE